MKKAILVMAMFTALAAGLITPAAKQGVCAGGCVYNGQCSGHKLCGSSLCHCP